MQNSVAVKKHYTISERFATSDFRANFLMLLAAFPYITPISFGTDTQPFSLLFSLAIILGLLASRNVTMPGSMFALLVMFFCTFVLFFTSTDKISAFRSLMGYATLFAVTFASYHTSRNIKAKWLNFSVYTWLSFGVIQFTASRYFGSFLLPRMSTSDGRGVTSLAVEPSYYAIVCVFLMIINDLLKANGEQEKRKHTIIMFLLLFQIVITYSGIGFLFLFVYMFSKFIAIILKEGIAKHIKKLILIGLAVFAILWAFQNINALEQSRAGGILRSAMIDPRYLLISDGSIADRLSHAVLPLYSIFYSSGIGLGMGTWSDHFSELRSYAGGFVEIMAQNASGGRIMSGWGTAVYELGILGFVYPFIFIRVMRRGAIRRKELSSVFVASGITIFALMFMAVPLAFPMFSYMLGMFMYHANAKQN